MFIQNSLGLRLFEQMQKLVIKSLHNYSCCFCQNKLQYYLLLCTSLLQIHFHTKGNFLLRTSSAFILFVSPFKLLIIRPLPLPPNAPLVYNYICLYSFIFMNNLQSRQANNKLTNDDENKIIIITLIHFLSFHQIPFATLAFLLLVLH